MMVDGYNLSPSEVVLFRFYEGKHARLAQIEEQRQKKLTYYRRWFQTHKHEHYVLNRRYLAKKKGAVGSYTLPEWQALKKRCGFTCQHCHRKEPEISLTRDHIIPLSKGGSDYITNLQPLCMDCNRRKKNKLPLVDNGLA
jgi:5-methylcytosine-specific restriction endonuclease McrA